MAASNLKKCSVKTGRAADKSSLCSPDMIFKRFGLIKKPRGKALKIFLKGAGGSGIAGTAFDAILIDKGPRVDLSDPADIRRNRKRIRFVEIKTTSRYGIGSDFNRYFFSVSQNQFDAGAKLGGRYLFFFINLRTGKHLRLTKAQLDKRIKSKTTSYSIQI
jgi:hypothetical protein